MLKLLTIAACCAALATGSVVLAKDHGPSGGSPKGQEHGKGHKHSHKNAHNLLGDKLKHDGKHAIGKFKDHDVVADVKGGKVTNMTAGDAPVKRVKSKDKMALNGGFVRLASNGPIVLAQYDDYYYGYCFDDGYDYDCYWYPASDVDYADYTWDDYDPYY